MDYFVSTRELFSADTNEEKKCLERSRSKKPLYVNAVVKCIQMLRTEVKNQEKEEMKSRPLIRSGPAALVTHLQVEDEDKIYPSFGSLPGARIWALK